MSDEDCTVPWELRAIGAHDVGIILGLAPRTVLETVACRPDFPLRVSMRPATWVAGEVLKWRDENRGIPKDRNGKRISASAAAAAKPAARRSADAP